MESIEKIFEFNSPFDANLLDQVVQTAYSGRGEEQKICMDALTRFQHHPESWNRVDQILERCHLPQSKYLGLSVMEKLIQQRWKLIPKSQRDAIKQFLLSLLLREASSNSSLPAHKLYLNKIDVTIVELLKQEWPHEWPTFIPDLIESSRSNLVMCENNLQILKYLSEEIYDFSEEFMTQKKIKYLKGQMEGEFAQVFQLCLEVFNNAQTNSLVLTALDTLLRFLTWIPLNFVFESSLLNILVSRFLPIQEFRNLTIKCMTQIASQQMPDNYKDRLTLMFDVVLESVKEVIPIEIDLAAAYEVGNDNEQEYVQNIAIFFTSCLEKHLETIEKGAAQENLLLAHQYLVNISKVEEREVFKICLEYWSTLLSGLFNEVQCLPGVGQTLLNIPSIGAPPSQMLSGFPLRKHLYATILTQLRVLVINRMVKPEEVLIVENEDGEVIREFTKETDTLVLYKSMRECLVYLTHLDVNDTEEIMTKKLASQVDESEWSRSNLNKLCWSIGSISGAMHEDLEKRFLVTVIKDLLSLTEIKRGKDNKAIVASNIMYIVGQYPRFLRAHWKFLKTVANKLFEFMHESHEGVQDMACDTFMTISQSCRRHFAVTQSGEVVPYIETIIENLANIVFDLTPPQTHLVYESCGCMISAVPNDQQQQLLVARLLENSNNKWGELIRDPTILDDNEKVKQLGNCIKANSAVCRSVGPNFIQQLSLMFNDLLTVYKTCSSVIDSCISTQGPVAIRTPKVRNLRVVRKETLRLLEAYISRAQDLEAISVNVLPPLMTEFLIAYNRSLPISREAEVLDLFSTTAEKLGPLFQNEVQNILNAVLQCTIDQIRADYIEFPDIRSSFYNLLHKMIVFCPGGILQSQPETFDILITTLVFGFKHTLRDISETALSISYELFKFVMGLEPEMRDSFYRAYLFKQLYDVLQILFDSDHKNGFHSQCKTIAQFIQIIDNNFLLSQISDPLLPRTPDCTTNSQYLQNFMIALILNAYPHLAQNAVQSFVQGLCLFNSDLNKFKLHVRDFLISLKEFGNDNADLYLADREIEQAQKQLEAREAALQVPGLIKPADMPSMED